MSARRELVIAVVALLAEMREAQVQLGHRVDRHAGPPVQLPPQKVTVASFAEGLGKTWQAGERRPIHRRPYVRRKPVPPRPSMLEPMSPASRHCLRPNRRGYCRSSSRLRTSDLRRPAASHPPALRAVLARHSGSFGRPRRQIAITKASVASDKRLVGRAIANTIVPHPCDPEGVLISSYVSDSCGRSSAY